MQKRLILCMFSGGVDSTGALWKLVTEDRYKDFKILVHHIDMVNREGRAKSEEIAVQKIIIELCKMGYKDRFTYTQSTFDYTFFDKESFPYFVKDALVVCFLAGMMCNGNRFIEYAVTGRTRSDDNQNLPMNSAMRDRINKGREIFNIIVPDRKIQKVKPSFKIVVGEMEKKEIWDILPVNIRDLVAYCRFPQIDGDGFRDCNKCRTCKEMKVIKNAN